MKLRCLVIGKTNEDYLREGIQIFTNRLKHYCSFEWEVLPDIKKFGTTEDLKTKEGHLFLSKISDGDFVILLDENGNQRSSESWAAELENYALQARKSLIFIIGGAFGVSQALKDRSDKTMSLSKMTFSHQMIRLFFIEQLYRAYTILKNENYHNP